jgi:sugar/nucleoside kinase (ribokinase family)
VFGHDLTAGGVAFRPSAPAEDTPTGRCIIVVTGDAQRTMNTYLGVSSLLCADDLDEATIAEGAVLYMEGYLFDRDDAKKAFRRAAAVAHEHGRKVSLTLSDSFCVDRHRDDFAALVHEDVDLLFGNGDELCSLYQVGDLATAMDKVRGECELAAITAGKDGSHVVTADEVVSVPAEDVSRVLDTTGAGDLYAAGFLYGYSRSRPLAECARLGSIAAAEVISHVGPRPLVPLRLLLP